MASPWRFSSSSAVRKRRQDSSTTFSLSGCTGRSCCSIGLLLLLVLFFLASSFVPGATADDSSPEVPSPRAKHIGEDWIEPRHPAAFDKSEQRRLERSDGSNNGERFIRPSSSGAGSMPYGRPAVLPDNEQFISPRIINGEDVASPDDYPFFTTRWSSFAICGAALIAPDFILTAAHCANAFSSGDALVGAYVRDASSHGAVIVQILETIVHEQFLLTEFVIDNDIMLLHLESPVTTKQPVPLNLDSARPGTGEELVTIGMGMTSDSPTFPNVLQEAQVFKVSDHECDSDWGSFGNITHHFLCAWKTQPELSQSCGGDSGGPLLDRVGNLVGLVSFGDESCLAGERAAAYTRVSAYRDWLRTHVCTRSVAPPDSLNCSAPFDPPPTPPPTTVEKCALLSECTPPLGLEYRGCVAETASGRACQRWDQQTPHEHTRTPGNYPNAGLASNFCRNPDVDGNGNWCYTLDPNVRWEYCNISECQTKDDEQPATAPPNTLAPVSSIAAPPTAPTSVPPTLAPSLSASAKCAAASCRLDDGSDYRGCRNVTWTGKTCQRWDAQSPHIHSRHLPWTDPNAGLEANYCRNPDSDAKGNWCFTTDPTTRWEYCHVPECSRSGPSPQPSGAPSTFQPTAFKRQCSQLGQACTGAASCCVTQRGTRPVCSGPSASPNRTCKPCARKNQLCRTSRDCCRPFKQYKCDKGACTKCRQRNRKCRIARDCCHAKAKCVKDIKNGKKQQRGRCSQ